MRREEKAAFIDEVAEQLSSADAVYAVDYRGISVSQAAELRGRLHEHDATFRVTKNRLTKLAAAKAGRTELDDLLSGPTALTFVNGDAAAAAKAINTFAREHQVMSVKGGLLGSEVLDPDAFRAIAQLPSRNQLEGQLAGVVASPLTGLVRGLGSMISGLAVALQQVADQGLVGGAATEESTEPEPAAEAEAESEADSGATAEADSEPAADAAETGEQQDEQGSDESGSEQQTSKNADAEQE